MFDPKQLDEIARKLTEVLPPGVRDLQKDMERNFRAVLHSAFSKMDLVQRDEVENLTDMLVRTRSRVDALEERLSVLEGTAPEPNGSSSEPVTET
ncbi:MAG: accessory factor UbiK family protein [Gammaproteobacteria bacterium]|nr:accessory factor UbiK family protein [Gammaproteobacteria bacterium]